MNKFHIFLMVYTAVVVLVKDFLTGVLTALIIYWLYERFFASGDEVSAVAAQREGSDATA
jgi:hypothetical protein